MHLLGSIITKLEIQCMSLRRSVNFGLQSPFFFKTKCNGLSQQLLDGRHSPSCNINSNSSSVALSFSDAERRALTVTGYPWIMMAYDIPCWMSFDAMKLHVRDGNSLSISRYTAVTLGLRQGKIEILSMTGYL